MARVVINQSDRATWGVLLPEGLTRLGRGSDQDLRIDDPSIAGAHCEVLVAQGRVYVRDLGAGAETRIDGTRLVGSTRIRNGQVLRLGRVEMRIEAEFSDLEPGTALRRRTPAMTTSEPVAESVPGLDSPQAPGTGTSHHRPPPHARVSTAILLVAILATLLVILLVARRLLTFP